MFCSNRQQQPQVILVTRFLFSLWMVIKKKGSRTWPMKVKSYELNAQLREKEKHFLSQVMLFIKLVLNQKIKLRQHHMRPHHESLSAYYCCQMPTASFSRSQINKGKAILAILYNFVITNKLFHCLLVESWRLRTVSLPWWKG